MPKVALIVIALFFAVTIIGGYFLNWSWTGFDENDTLWDWLNLVLLPVTIAFLPVWLLSGAGYRTGWHVFLVLLLFAFVVTLIGGYGYSWTWTGYQGNTLWDWIKLLFVPAVIPLLAMWLKEEQGEGRSASDRDTTQ